MWATCYLRADTGREASIWPSMVRRCALLTPTKCDAISPPKIPSAFACQPQRAILSVKMSSRCASRSQATVGVFTSQFGVLRSKVAALRIYAIKPTFTILTQNRQCASCEAPVLRLHLRGAVAAGQSCRNFLRSGPGIGTGFIFTLRSSFSSYLTHFTYLTYFHAVVLLRRVALLLIPFPT